MITKLYRKITAPKDEIRWISHRNRVSWMLYKAASRYYPAGCIIIEEDLNWRFSESQGRGVIVLTFDAKANHAEHLADISFLEQAGLVTKEEARRMLDDANL